MMIEIGYAKYSKKSCSTLIKKSYSLHLSGRSIFFGLITQMKLDLYLDHKVPAWLSGCSRSADRRPFWSATEPPVVGYPEIIRGALLS